MLAPKQGMSLFRLQIIPASHTLTLLPHHHLLLKACELLNIKASDFGSNFS